MVYRAIQESLGRPVALKVMNPLFSDTEEFSERFLDEGRLLAAVRHSNIITIHDIGISDGFHYIAMEYVEGGDLGEKIKAGLDTAQATAYIETLASCLSLAHEKHIVHRDIKPANILFRDDGTLLLTDFGIAKQLTSGKELTATGAMVGSPHYLSPEQAQGKTVDGRADIYSLGVMYYEMLTGTRPFIGDSDVDIAIKHVTEPVPDLPEHLSAFSKVIDRMTRKDPEERFPSCASLLQALAEIRETGTWSGQIAPIALPQAPEDAGTPHTKKADDASAAHADADTSSLSNGGDTLVLEDADIHQGDTVVETPATPEEEPAGDTQVLDPTGDAPPAASSNPGDAAHAKPKGRRLMVAAVGAAAVLAVAFALFTREQKPVYERTAAAATAPESGKITQRNEAENAEQERRARELLIESLMADAQRALDDYHLTTPERSSAYSYFQKVLKIDPAHPAALQGMREIADRYLKLAWGSEDDWDYDRAMRHIKTGLEVQPDHAGLLNFKRELESSDGKTGRAVKKSLKGVKALFN